MKAQTVTRFLLPALLALAFAPAALAGSFEVTIRAVDENGKPVPKADVSLHWELKAGVMTPRNGGNYAAGMADTPTDADGRATLRVDGGKDRRPVLAYSADRKLCGRVGVAEADAGRTLTLTMAPPVTVKGRLAVAGANKPPAWGNTVFIADGFRDGFSQDVAADGSFAFPLPAGKYKLVSFAEEAITAKTEHTFAAGRAEHDLGTITLEPTPLAKLVGKPSPKWEYADIRGLKAGTQAADFKGKWLLVEFWGTWCGPCVKGALPELIGLDGDHAAHRDQYAIVTVHCRTPDTFAGIDRELPAIQASCWGGKPLPFPMLIDGGKMADTFGIIGFPTGILVDPQGNVVGKAFARDLEAKLPKLPAATLWKRHRDMRKNAGWGFDGKSGTPRTLAAFFADCCDTPVALDEPALKAVGLDPDAPLPAVFCGHPVTLRGYEALLLAPHGLGVAPDPAGKGLRITAKVPLAEPPSPVAAYNEKQVNAALDRPAAALALDGTPLREAARRIGAHHGVPVALDAAALKSGKLDPDAKLTARLGGADPRAALADALKPLGLTFAVRSEAIVIGPAMK